VALLELAPPVLAPVSDSSTDPGCLHLSSIEFLRQRQQQLELASYGERLIAGACALHIPGTVFNG
jgi:hypothetical protein